MPPAKRRIMKKKEEAVNDGSTKAYYTAAHSIQEEVTAQPDMLVGGQLKEYQVCSCASVIN